MTDKIEITSELLTDLKEKAGKAMPGPWELDETPTDIATYYEIYSTDWMVADCEKDGASAAFIAAANPAVVLALIERIERLEKENEELRANNYGPEILNDPQALTASYFAGRMAEGREQNAREDKLLDEKERLEKEANWLANKLVAATEMLANATGMETDDLNEAGWRKVARETVENNNGSN